ncbi:hypothetical protein [Geminicoccus roseus]|uniref:hypothetical protein n=1 Tax=Geminicoccus roseus TaxID=404900 RepID=UPI0004057235|nr:hypothetical protein [Geminicoccus roseus]
MHGKRFFSYMTAAATHYRHAHLVVCDTLDVHNMAPSPDLRAEALETARAMGDRWLRKHFRQLHDAFEGRVTLTRWDDVKADPTFQPRYEAACALYERSEAVRAWVDDVCGMYARLAAQRQIGSGFVPDLDRLFRRSLAYMLEEIAGTAVYHGWYQSPAVYPGPYFDDPYLFNREQPGIDLSVPAQCAVIFADDSAKAA